MAVIEASSKNSCITTKNSTKLRWNVDDGIFDAICKWALILQVFHAVVANDYDFDATNYSHFIETGEVFTIYNGKCKYIHVNTLIKEDLYLTLYLNREPASLYLINPGNQLLVKFSTFPQKISQPKSMLQETWPWKLRKVNENQVFCKLWKRIFSLICSFGVNSNISHTFQIVLIWNDTHQFTGDEINLLGQNWESSETLKTLDIDGSGLIQIYESTYAYYNPACDPEKHNYRHQTKCLFENYGQFSFSIFL